MTPDEFKQQLRVSERQVEEATTNFVFAYKEFGTTIQLEGFHAG